MLVCYRQRCLQCTKVLRAIKLSYCLSSKRTHENSSHMTRVLSSLNTLLPFSTVQEEETMEERIRKAQKKIEEEIASGLPAMESMPDCPQCGVKCTTHELEEFGKCRACVDKEILADAKRLAAESLEEVEMIEEEEEKMAGLQGEERASGKYIILCKFSMRIQGGRTVC